MTTYKVIAPLALNLPSARTSQAYVERILFLCLPLSLSLSLSLRFKERWTQKSNEEIFQDESIS